MPFEYERLRPAKITVMAIIFALPSVYSEGPKTAGKTLDLTLRETRYASKHVH
jgi:hypothetical protein